MRLCYWSSLVFLSESAKIEMPMIHTRPVSHANCFPYKCAPLCRSCNNTAPESIMFWHTFITHFMWIAFAFTCPSSRICNSRRIYSYFTTNWHYMGLLLLYSNAILQHLNVLLACVDKPTCNNRKT